MEVALWLSLALILYSYFGYPLVLMLLDRLVTARRAPLQTQPLPSVTVIVAAYNEADCIAGRLDNLLALDYPRDRLSIIVGDDGSTDATRSIIESNSDPRVTLVHFSQNRGKAATLNDLVAQAGSELIVFSDANTHFDEGVLRHLVRHFEDAGVDAVCGELRLEGEGGPNQDGLYWRYEQFLKRIEGRIGGLLGANGANYAIRTRCYSPLREDTLIDDFTIVMRIAMAGGTVVYDESALAHESVAPTVQDEYRRRVRIGAGNYQAFFRLFSALHPRHGMLAFAFFSHKVLRWFTPHLLIVAGVCLLVLAMESAFYLLLAILSIALVLICLGMPRLGLASPAPVLTFWLMMNLAMFHGWLVFLSGVKGGTWNSTPHPPNASDSHTSQSQEHDRSDADQ
ncbi:MAG: glycosyltransferase family 2 protein [Proteobacteria bacterium]|nr:glycosyltransferase family 2 protein [Pseudomonadota bacterium]